MSDKFFSKFKSKSKKPAGHQVGIAASYHVINEFENINKKKNRGDRLNFQVIHEMEYGGRGPMRPLVERQSLGSEAYILGVSLLPDNDYEAYYPSMIAEMDFILDLEEGERKYVALLFYHHSEDFLEIGKHYEDWIEKTSKDHKLERFDVCTNNQTGFSDVHNWISDQIIPKKTVAQANAKTADTNSHGFRWLAKLSKAALTFGVRTSQVKE